MIGFVAHDQNAGKRKRGEWVEITALIRCEFDAEYGGDVPVLYVQSVKPTEAIADLVTFS